MISPKSDARKFLQKLTSGPLTAGRMLRAERLGEEIPQKEFAQKLGIPVTHLCDIEKGRKQVSPGRAARFAKTLGLSERQFIRVALQDLLEHDGLEGLEISVTDEKKGPRHGTRGESLNSWDQKRLFSFAAPAVASSRVHARARKAPPKC